MEHRAWWTDVHQREQSFRGQRADHDRTVYRGAGEGGLIETSRFDRFDVVSFDCYGTLVDWEAGILAALRPVLGRHRIRLGDEEILEAYARIEAELEAGDYIAYRDVLRRVMTEMSRRLGFEVRSQEADCIADSIGTWRPFPDTIGALRRLAARFKLAVISNVDDDLFEATARTLEVPFGWVITAEQARAYKPSHRNFELALTTIGLPREHLLHVAQSLYHDIAPATALGIATVWVNRRRGRPGHGATHPASAEPDIEVANLDELATLLGA